MDKSSIDEIKKLETDVFDVKTILELPFEFYNLIAQAISDPKLGDQLPIPPEVEEYFKKHKTKEASALFKVLTKSGLSSGEKTFTGAYIDLIIRRYENAFRMHGKYSLRRIQTIEEYGLLNQLKVNNVPSQHYIAFEIDSFVPKLPNGEVDFIRLKEQENKTSQIAALFSVITSLQEVATIFKEC